MEVKKMLKQMLGWNASGLSEGPTYRCLRCGSEFERNHTSCPECGAAFVALAEEE